MNNSIESSYELADEAVFCPDQLIERCLGKIEFARRVLDIFLSNVHRDVDELLDAARAKNNVQLVQTAHRIKGSAASISAQRMQRLMAEIEEAGRQDAMPDVETLQRRVHCESESLERVLARWRNENRANAATSNNSIRRVSQWGSTV